MKILYIFIDEPTELSDRVVSVHMKDNEVKVIDLSKKKVPYEKIIDDVFYFDKVICW
ncbi:MAG: hypothetical protein LLF28_02995 [Nitrospiraceae bacterium]|nr:hypothetical protein [Nitrospiraceae bacterium]